MPTYTLNYFAFPGRAECVRLVFHLAGQEFTDNTFTFADWPEHKKDATRFPLGQCPTLQVDGETLNQSLSILRFVGNEFNMAGSTNMEKYKVDMIVDTTTDCAVKSVGPILGFGGLDTQEKKQEAAKKVLEDCKRSWEYLQTQLEKNNGGSGYMVGDKITIADLSMMNVLNSMVVLKASFFNDFPLLKAYHERVCNHDGVKSYYEKNPATTMPSLLD